MPRTKSIATLEGLCLNAVTVHYEEREVQDRLVSLPPVLINKTFERLCVQFDDDKTDRRLQSNIFLHSRAVSLHHLHLFSTTMTPLYDEIGKVCKNLMDLTLDDDLNVSTASIIKLVWSLPKLEHLKLRSPHEITDGVAAAIGTNCPLLTHLDASFSLHVTNDGLRSLSRCVKLEWLNIRSTDVTTKGCLFLLNQLPVLKVFKHHRWNELYPKLAQQLNTNETSRTYCIEKLPETNAKDIHVLKTFFPNLRVLDIYFIEDHVDLNILVWAQRLKSLKLYGVRQVNIGLIHHIWPMLEKLSLTDCSISNQSDGVVNAPLKNLRQLCLGGDLFTTGQAMKSLIVRCERLERLWFSDCGMNVSDDLISELAESNSLQCLKTLIFLDCHHISSTSIIKLLGVPNPMNKLVLRGCDLINVSAYNEIISFVNSKNLDLFVDFLE